MEIIDLPAGDPRWEQALPVLRQLRTNLRREDLDAVLSAPEAQRPSYFAAFVGEACVGVCGWRLIANTFNGLELYVDDLVTDDTARSRGMGSALLAHAEALARRAGCKELGLDSGVQRHGAHRFYLRERMDIAAYHFVKTLEPTG